MSISFPKLEKFLSIISLNRFCNLSVFSSLSDIIQMQIFVYLLASQKFGI
jgi:hypothetical protein